MIVVATIGFLIMLVVLVAFLIANTIELNEVEELLGKEVIRASNTEETHLSRIDELENQNTELNELLEQSDNLANERDNDKADEINNLREQMKLLTWKANENERMRIHYQHQVGQQQTELYRLRAFVKNTKDQADEELKSCARLVKVNWDDTKDEGGLIIPTLKE